MKDIGLFQTAYLKGIMNNFRSEIIVVNRARLLAYAVAILAALPGCIPSPGDSREARTLGNLGSLRNALSIYAGDHRGAYPSTLDSILNTSPDSLREIPLAEPALFDKGYHPAFQTVKNFSSRAEADDAGGWGYINVAQLGGKPNPEWGVVFVNCTHADRRGISWNKVDGIDAKNLP